MNEANLNALADHFGILPSFSDFDGNQIVTSRETKLALLRANGLELDNDAMVSEAVEAFIVADQNRWFPKELIVTADRPFDCNFGLGSTWQLELDERIGLTGDEAPDSDQLEGKADTHIRLPALPAGIHELTIDVSGRREMVLVIAAPDRAPSIEQICGHDRIWGLNAALYGLRSDRNSGMGDFEDLANLCTIVSDRGGSFTGINPVHSLGFSDPFTISPYSPSHRGFFNTQHIALDRISGLDGLPRAQAILSAVAGEFEKLRAGDRIDYIQHRSRHNAALRDLYTIFLQNAEPLAISEFETYRILHGDSLLRYALFEALSEENGADWHSWPEALKNRDEVALDGARDRLSAHISFYSWLQWVASSQLEKAQKCASDKTGGLGLYLDLAVGARRGGAEAWCEATSVAEGVSLGAPPDQLAPGGQNWGLMTYAPARLASRKYKSLRHIYRAAMQYAGVLRIDHVLGLNRSFWIPDDGSNGAYITQPMETLLAILAIEAQSTNTAVIGEDLGLVPDGFRDRVQARGIYGYSVLQYEKRHDGCFKSASELRPFSLACISTHDTPTLKGYIAGRDIDWWRSLGNWSEEKTCHEHEVRKRDVAAMAAMDEDQTARDDISFAHLFDVVHKALACSDVAMISVQLDDVLGLADAQNLPGTIDEHPNWRRRCPIDVENLASNETFYKLAGMMKASHRGNRGD